MTGVLNPALPYFRSLYPKNETTPGRAGSWVGLLNHSLEAPDNPNMARSLAQGWFRNPANETSVNAVVDRGEVIQTYPFKSKTWGCGTGNDYVIVQTEHVGYAAWSKAQWRTPTMLQMIQNSAEHQAWCWYKFAMQERGITYYPEWLSLTQIDKMSRSGLLTHNDARLVWGGTTHTDPGKNFPYTELRDAIHAALDRILGKKPSPTPTPANTYTVKRNDTLSAIAQRFKVKGGYQELARINGIKNPDVIHIGQELKLTGKATPTPAPVKPKPKPLVTGPMHGKAVPAIIRKGTGKFFGSYSGSKYSLGGYNLNERVFITLIQRQLIYLGFVPGVPSSQWATSGWADGIFDNKTDAPGTGPTSMAVARFQRKYMPHTRYYGQVWWDDWEKLASL